VFSINSYWVLTYIFLSALFAVLMTMQKMQRLQLRYSESEYFKVVCPTANKQRVGCGLSIKYLIRFSPDIKKVVTLMLLKCVVANINCVASVHRHFICKSFFARITAIETWFADGRHRAEMCNKDIRKKRSCNMIWYDLHPSHLSLNVCMTLFVLQTYYRAVPN